MIAQYTSPRATLHASEMSWLCNCIPGLPSDELKVQRTARRCLILLCLSRVASALPGNPCRVPRIPPDEGRGCDEALAPGLV